MSMEGMPENKPESGERSPDKSVEKRRNTESGFVLDSLSPQDVVMMPSGRVGINLHVGGETKFESMTGGALAVSLETKLANLDRLKRELISNIDDTKTRLNLRQTMLDGLRQAGLKTPEDADLKILEADKKLLRKQETDLIDTEREMNEFSSLLQKLRETK